MGFTDYRQREQEINNFKINYLQNFIELLFYIPPGPDGSMVPFHLVGQRISTAAGPVFI